LRHRGRLRKNIWSETISKNSPKVSLWTLHN